MKKYILFSIAILAISAIVTFNIQVVMSDYSGRTSVSLAGTEKLAFGEKTGEEKTKYNKNVGDCSKEFTADIQGYVTIRGKKFRVGGAYAKYTETYYGVKVDCPIGNNYDSCTECSCGNFWASKC